LGKEGRNKFVFEYLLHFSKLQIRFQLVTPAERFSSFSAEATPNQQRKKKK
jgi:hypothetical protein